MKRHQISAAVNNQEDEDFEGYALYPEHAIGITAQKKQNESHVANAVITESLIGDTYKLINILEEHRRLKK